MCIRDSYETVTAESPEAAREKVMALIDKNEIDVYGQDIDEAMILSCRKTPTMFCITRPGTTVTGTSRLQPGDEPRLPHDYARHVCDRDPPREAHDHRGARGSDR